VIASRLRSHARLDEDCPHPPLMSPGHGFILSLDMFCSGQAKSLLLSPNRFRTVESRLAEIDRLLTSKPAAKLPNFTDEQIREFLQKECKDFCELLKGDPEVAKREIQKRIKKLVLTPKQTPTGTMLEVTGDMELFQHQDVMLNNSLERIGQHYTLPHIQIAAMLDPSLPLAA
jgi:hypothetical protein